MDRDALQVELNLKDRKSFRERYLHPVLKAGFIAVTIPDKPRSRLQRCRLTAAGDPHVAARKEEGNQPTSRICRRRHRE